MPAVGAPRHDVHPLEHVERLRERFEVAGRLGLGDRALAPRDRVCGAALRLEHRRVPGAQLGGASSRLVAGDAVEQPARPRDPRERLTVVAELLLGLGPLEQQSRLVKRVVAQQATRDRERLGRPLELARAVPGVADLLVELPEVRILNVGNAPAGLDRPLEQPRGLYVRVQLTRALRGDRSVTPRLGVPPRHDEVEREQAGRFLGVGEVGLEPTPDLPVEPSAQLVRQPLVGRVADQRPSEAQVAHRSPPRSNSASRCHVSGPGTRSSSSTHASIRGSKHHAEHGRPSHERPVLGRERIDARHRGRLDGARHPTGTAGFDDRVDQVVQELRVPAGALDHESQHVIGERAVLGGDLRHRERLVHAERREVDPADARRLGRLEARRRSADG